MENTIYKTPTTDNKVENLEWVNPIEQAKQTLKEAGYFVDNLWSINDVQDKYKCTDEQAQKVLNQALTHSFIIENINEQIEWACQEILFEEIEN